MNQKHNRSFSELEITEFINRWELEISIHGYIKEESELLFVLKSISEKNNPVIYSKILTLLAQSKDAKDENASLTTTWLKKALELDPDNPIAIEYLLQDKWKDYQSIFDTLDFPSFRETDNRPAKKKVIDDYLNICRDFLFTADETLDDLKKQNEPTTYLEQSAFGKKIEIMTYLFEKMVDEVGVLLKAVSDFDESFSGVFYTSFHYENIKLHIENIQSIKDEWMALFKKDEEDHPQQINNALDQLNEMIGLNTVKERVKDFYSFLKYQKSRSLIGFQSKDQLSLNMILTGNPGTGKTTLARLLAKIYHELGVLPREEVIETNRAQLVGAYVGQTEENVLQIVKKAIGGVLFIDEAYSLKREGQTGTDYGQSAIDTLVSLMTSNEFGGKFAVILAGYPEEMRQFLEANTGLRSRFPLSNFIHLPDYSKDELLQIADLIAHENDFLLTNEAKLEITNRLNKEKVDTTFGNARAVKNIILEAIFRKGSRLEWNESFIQFMLLDKEDFINHTQPSMENPSDQLKQLIGLEDVKHEVESLLAFVKVQKLRHDNGLPIVPIQLHAVFSGNPGTGKTTVAKIYAMLLNEYGFLKRGHLIVTSRADFVAGYVGQTAIKTKKKIKEALGGVLFIDEAYSLLSQSSGDFGKEMIDTLVDEMTKHKENLVVILAGYPTEMKNLIESNPGLRSRFKKYLFFPDYTIEELITMMEHYGEQYQYHLSVEAKAFLQSTLKKKTPAGNGRFVTNLIDEAIQAQSLRMVNDASIEDYITKTIYLEKSDIEMAFNKIDRGEI